MTKVDLQVNVDLLTQEIEFLRTLYEAVSSLLLDDILTAYPPLGTSITPLLGERDFLL